MSFTEEHKAILEKHKEHWESLREVQFMRNVDKPVFDDLQRVHNEAIGVYWFSPWCSSCVADMVRILYTQYDKTLRTEPSALVTNPETKKPNRKQRRHGQQQQVSGE